METKELVELLERLKVSYYVDRSEVEIIVAIIKRLEELDEIKGIIRKPNLTHDYTMLEFIEKLKRVRA